MLARGGDARRGTLLSPRMRTPPIDGLETLNDRDLAALRERFQRLGFLPEVLARAESVAPGQLDAVSLPLVRWTLRHAGDSASRLALLFSYGDGLPVSELEPDLGAGLLTRLGAAGLLVKDGDRVRCPFRLVPLEGLWLAGDEPSAGQDAVMGPGPTTLELLGQLPSRAPGPALDIGTGAGTLALVLATRGAAPVVATDLNARATALAAFNARLNDRPLDVRRGDLTSPVQGERFRWVVSQPAFVFHPPGAEEVTFLHGGARGDELTFRLFRELPPLLAPDGLGLVMFDTPLERDAPVVSRVRAALAAPDLDVIVLAAPGASAGAQAVAYAALEDPSLGDRYAEAVTRNRAHLESLGTREWVRALAVVRPARLQGSPLTVQLPVDRLRAAPDALEQLLGGLELAALPDDALRPAVVRPLPALQLQGEVTLGGDLVALEARPARGSLAAGCALDGDALALLGALEDAPDVAHALSALPEPRSGSWLARIRELASRGLLVRRR